MTNQEEKQINCLMTYFGKRHQAMRHSLGKYYFETINDFNLKSYNSVLGHDINILWLEYLTKKTWIKTFIKDEEGPFFQPGFFKLIEQLKYLEIQIEDYSNQAYKLVERIYDMILVLLIGSIRADGKVPLIESSFAHNYIVERKEEFEDYSTQIRNLLNGFENIEELANIQVDKLLDEEYLEKVRSSITEFKYDLRLVDNIHSFESYFLRMFKTHIKNAKLQTTFGFEFAFSIKLKSHLYWNQSIFSSLKGRLLFNAMTTYNKDPRCFSNDMAGFIFYTFQKDGYINADVTLAKYITFLEEECPMMVFSRPRKPSEIKKIDFFNKLYNRRCKRKNVLEISTL